MTGSTRLLRLYPDAGARTLPGVYLDEPLRELGSRGRPFVYANFVSSLDGRIAVVDSHSEQSKVPSSLTNDLDWRLFQELQAHADCLVTHGGYLRALAAGTLGNILQIGLAPEAADIGEWRKQQGMERQPAVAVVSASLDFELPSSLERHSQPVHLFSGSAAPSARVQRWRAAGYDVHHAGKDETVEGRPLIEALARLGYERICLLAGPRLFAATVRDGVLDRLYLTLTHQLMGGERFHSIVEDPMLGEAGRLQLRSLYHDPGADDRAGQWFCSFDVR